VHAEATLRFGSRAGITGWLTLGRVCLREQTNPPRILVGVPRARAEQRHRVRRSAPKAAESTRQPLRPSREPCQWQRALSLARPSWRRAIVTIARRDCVRRNVAPDIANSEPRRPPNHRTCGQSALGAFRRRMRFSDSSREGRGVRLHSNGKRNFCGSMQRRQPSVLRRV